MAGIFWPTTRVESSTALVRAGRVLHWIGVATAGVFFVWGIYLAVLWGDKVGVLTLISATCRAMATLCIGRMFRLVLSKE